MSGVRPAAESKQIKPSIKRRPRGVCAGGRTGAIFCLGRGDMKKAQSRRAARNKHVSVARAEQAVGLLYNTGGTRSTGCIYIILQVDGPLCAKCILIYSLGAAQKWAHGDSAADYGCAEWRRTTKGSVSSFFAYILVWPREFRGHRCSWWIGTRPCLECPRETRRARSLTLTAAASLFRIFFSSASKGVAQTPFQQIECTWVHFDDAGASLVHSLAFSPVTLESDRRTADRWINGAALELISL